MVICDSCGKEIEHNKSVWGSYLDSLHCTKCAASIDIHEWAEKKEKVTNG